MAKYYLALLMVRLLLPAGLLLSIALRPFGLSVIYLLLYLIAPWPQVPDPRNSSAGSGKYLLVYVLVSICMLLLHVVWHSVLAAFGSYGSLLISYPLIQKIGYNLGLVSYNDIDPFMAIHYVMPELVASGTSLIVFLTVRKLMASQGPTEPRAKDTKHRRYPLLTNAGKYISLFLIMFSGIMRPSVSSGIYYLVFMGAATAWSLGRPLEKGYAVVTRCIQAIMGVHVAILLAYQSTWLSEMYPPEEDFARYFGLTKLVDMNSTDSSVFHYEVVENGSWATLASPLVILVTYYVLAIESRELFKPKVVFEYISSKALRGEPSETSPLLKTTSKRWSSVKAALGTRPLHQDSTGSIIHDEDSTMDVGEPTILDDIKVAVIDFFQVIVRSSYIATTITMMAWSIMYHSWLAFVFLMWANMVWLCQNQRSFMLKTSPVLVVYAMLLLLAEYIYGMNLLETELPSNITEVNLHQLGLTRAEGEPCIPLLFKSLFTFMFWVTLRQRIQEVRQRRQSAVVADMAAPLQLTVSAAASVIEAQKEEENRSRLLAIMGDWLKALCARYWIYVVVIMLFVIGITGERMTIFRILYMFLFLMFILMFQISWYYWRKLMYMFWITVIIYSMLNLILIYIYQFDNFSMLIETYLFIDKRLQHDLGLDKFHPADLFVKLLTPTLFLIITIMQVHYFHKDFMALTNPKTRSNSFARGAGSSRPSQTAASTIRDDLPPLPDEEERPPSPKSITEADVSAMDVTSMAEKSKLQRNLSRTRSNAPTITERPSTAFRDWLSVFVARARVVLADWIDKVFIFLDLHLIKIVLFALMLLCVLNVNAMHVPIMLLIAPACLMTRRKQRVVVLFISVLISVYLMAIMVYQIDYIQHSTFDVNCSSTTYNGTLNNTMSNNADWLGFHKAIQGATKISLATILKGYIAMIVMFTFNSLVLYRQQALREQVLKQKEKVMFPEITRTDADKDLIHCIKYLINYGFYKFGVEITLMCLIGVIGSRMDLYAVLYSFWLLALVSISRERQARVWGGFTFVVTVLVPLQYLIAVGLLPQFCVEYPWSGDSKRMKHVRTWLFLPYAEEPPHATKLIFDFLLLIMASRQLRVFRIERETKGKDFPGGCNEEEIDKDWESPGFINPVPDFLGNVTSWLDVVKRMVFLGMLWVTLAIMFLTGTNRVNVFSMGYLIGSFIFLWQGTDFYLRPKNMILKWWSWLVKYNVSVVVVKALLQIPGCMFSSAIQENACWLVQLFGIGCVDKFVGGNIRRFWKMNLDKASTCSVPQEDIGLAWDGVCFAFLILQRRLFHSYYFYRVIDESKATTILASRGAELMEELRQKQMLGQDEQERKILEKIKVKMERIKANQKKIQGVLTKDPHTHHHGRPRLEPPTSHQRAIRSGDYYMFDEFDDTDVQLKDEESSDDEDAPKKMGFGKDRPRRAEVHEGDINVILPEKEKDDIISELGDISEPPQQETLFEKFKRLLQTVCALISSILVSLTRHLMKYSRDYRYVSSTLSTEKRILKESEGFGVGIRKGSQKIWEPLPDAINNRPHKDVSALEDQDESMFRQEKSPVVHLGYALWFAVIAHTDIVCYIMVFINQIQSATILSIPLPLMVFLWGTLTIPRPTKTFWVTLIAYTEVIVLMKTMFQFEILPWNQNAIPTSMPFTAPRIIGIERKPKYAVYDLLLLLIIFLHRFMLKSLGLWKESTPETEIHEDVEYKLSPEDAEMIASDKVDEVAQKYIKLHEKGLPELEHAEAGSGAAVSGEEGAAPGSADEPGPSKAPSDDHYSVNDDEEPIIAVTTTIENNFHHYPQIIAHSVKRYLRPVHRFFKSMLAPGARVTADIYAYMFLCDFLNFMVVIFGFAAFGTHQGDGGVQAYLEENKVPIPFLIMLILQFALIVIDRALYLRKFMLGKIVFQYALIIGVHIWMFFVLPFITERTFNDRLPPPMWYMIKCVYLLLSAYQIRCGYPRRIIGNFLCKSYRFLNMICFRSFMAIPFVFELRTLMDWIWTDTSMTVMDWLKMEDIFASVFLLKCSRYMEDEFPQPRGQKKKSLTKYMVGGSALAFVIAIIWFPLVLFALGNTVGEPNPPTDVTVKIRIGPFLPVYQMSAQSHNIYLYTQQDYNQLSNKYARDRNAQTFLSNYIYDDVAVVTINANSTMTWDISPPELQRLEAEAVSNASLTIKFSYVITHPSNNPQNPPTIEESREVALEAYVDGQRNPERDKLLQLLAGNATEDTWIQIDALFPKFVKVFNKGIARPTYQLMPSVSGDPTKSPEYRGVMLRLERESNVMYWRVREDCESADHLLSIPKNNCDMLVMYTFNDKLFPETLNFISGGGIIGLYTTFVFLASRMLRGFFSGIYTKIMFDDLPNVDRVLQLCLDIYLVREAVELTLEEDLFAKLVFLYRSPETMIKWSRPKEEEEQRALPPSR